MQSQRCPLIGIQLGSESVTLLQARYPGLAMDPTGVAAVGSRSFPLIPEHATRRTSRQRLFGLTARSEPPPPGSFELGDPGLILQPGDECEPAIEVQTPMMALHILNPESVGLGIKYGRFGARLWSLESDGFLLQRPHYPVRLGTEDQLLIIDNLTPESNEAFVMNIWLNDAPVSCLSLSARRLELEEGCSWFDHM